MKREETKDAKSAEISVEISEIQSGLQEKKENCDRERGDEPECYSCLIDEEYMIQIRRTLHRYPETGFDLPRTVALVKEELEKIGIPYSENLGKSSIVAVLEPGNTERFSDCSKPCATDFVGENATAALRTIALRADMDALPIEEKTGLPYASEIPGKMHACGHDAHTAILLGTAKALYEMREILPCRVKFIFQACEEGPESGAELLVADGVMDDVDLILGLHVDGWTPAGKVGVCRGNSMASQRSFKLEFFGKTAHATLPQTGCDALSAAVRAYTGIHEIQTRVVDPFQPFICSIGKLAAGHTQNVVPDYAEILGTIRTFDMELDKTLIGKIEQIAEHAASEYGVKVKVSSLLNMYNLYNDPDLCEKLEQSAAKVVGAENLAQITPKLSSEDFSQYLTKKPGLLFRLGTRKEAKGITTLPHNSDFQIAEEAMKIGCEVYVRFILDHMI